MKPLGLVYTVVASTVTYTGRIFVKCTGQYNERKRQKELEILEEQKEQNRLKWEAQDATREADKIKKVELYKWSIE